MNLQAVLQKTDKGVEEIATRKHKLEQKLRAILIAVNGKATGAELVNTFGQVGDITPVIARLLAEGYVREAGPAAADDFVELRVRLAQSLTDALGPAGDPIVMKLEECATPEDARAFVEAHRPMLQKVVGPRGARFLALAKELLG